MAKAKAKAKRTSSTGIHPAAARQSDPSGAPLPTVYIVDDDDAMRESLQFLVGSVGLPTEAFASAEQFLAHFSPTARGCVLLDVRMPGMSGIELHEQLRASRIAIPVIILTAHADVPMAVRAMRAGAFDFIEKPCNDQVLLDRIHQAIERDADARLDRDRADDIQQRLEKLSPRERQVLELVVAGFANKQVAGMLELSIKTVEVHRGHVMSKMQAASLADLVRMAMLAGID